VLFKATTLKVAGNFQIPTSNNISSEIPLAQAASQQVIRMAIAQS